MAVETEGTREDGDSPSNLTIELSRGLTAVCKFEVMQAFLLLSVPCVVRCVVSTEWLGLLVVDCGLKKPFKLCCPLPGVAGVAGTEPDFERFRGLFEDTSVILRFVPVDAVAFVFKGDSLIAPKEVVDGTAGWELESLDRIGVALVDRLWSVSTRPSCLSDF